MKTVIVKTFPTRIEAEVDKGILNAVGIKSYISADDEGGMGPYLLSATGFVKLMVARKDYQKACKILKVDLT